MSLRLELPPIDAPEPAALEDVAGEREAPIRVVEGDNLAGLEALAREGVEVQLAYLDPPFFTQRKHHRTRRKRGAGGRMSRTEHLAFDDRWPNLASYLAALEGRLSRIRDLLAPEGCVVVHVDPTTSHYVKVICDELFGMEAFASEIVWRYRRWPAKTKNFQRVHDVLLRYVRDPQVKPRFNQLYEPLAPSTLATWGDKKQVAHFENGQRIKSKTTKRKSPGTPMGDVWEISVIAPVAKERTGYPTQKPEALLRRIVQALSDPGDVVLDPYAGSGTTLVAAADEGRRAIGIDASGEAQDVMRARCEARGHALWRQRVVRAQRGGKGSSDS